MGAAAGHIVFLDRTGLLMAYYFSPSRNAFFCDKWRPAYERASSWPTDAVPVNDSVFSAYGAASPPVGKIRGVDAEGAPTWVDAPSVLVPIQIQAHQALERARCVVWCEYVSIGEAVPAAWIAYQRALGAICLGTDVTSTALPAAPDA